MQNLRILNSKETKEILSVLESQYGADYSLLLKGHVLLMNKDNKLFIVNKEFGMLDTSKVRINSLGMYIGELHNNQVRLSIEGTQLLGKDAKKNVFELSKGQERTWLRGKDIEVEHENTGFLIMRCKNDGEKDNGRKHSADFLGAGKVKDNRLMNFVSKNRRIGSVY
ncbi:hypothetical protein HYU06_02765 [Candidatus Woesearchaeota archaeon]|nr:hypothetical protein [Candidatus Woesearchaeota archaeon]